MILRLAKLYDDVLPQPRGQIIQSLLGFTLEAAGYDVTPNYVGVPDLRATQWEIGAGFAIECKTGSPVVLSARDLKGIRECHEVGVLASFVYPSVRPHWWMTDATRLRARPWEWWELGRLPVIDLGFDVDETFVTVVNDVPLDVMMERTTVIEWGERRRRLGWTPIGVSRIKGAS
ncbi:MAG: hypothetical protein ACYCYK_12570 [Candidatus Dormibacteria bacterium]